MSKQRPLIVELPDETAPVETTDTSNEAAPDSGHASAQSSGVDPATSASPPPDPTAQPQRIAVSIALLDAVPIPAEGAFAEIGGCPCSEIDTAYSADAARQSANAASALSQLATSIAALTPDDILFGTPSSLANGSAGGAALEGMEQSLQPPPLIQEVTAEEGKAATPQLDAARVLAACGSYAADAALEGAWVTAKTDAAAAVAVQSLAAVLPAPSRHQANDMILAPHGPETGNDATRKPEQLPLWSGEPQVRRRCRARLRSDPAESRHASMQAAAVMA